MWKKVLSIILIILIIAVGGTFLYARSILSRAQLDKDFNALGDFAKKDSNDRATMTINWDKFTNANSSNTNIPNGVQNITVEDAKNALGIKKEAEDKLKDKNIKNVAVFGIDDYEGGGRSDSIIILSINKNKNTITLHSILRDSYVNIPGRGLDKINHAYAYGGPLLAIRTINENFNLNITDYISVDFNTVPQVIDYIGGVNVILSEAEAQVLGSAAGEVTLNGYQALSYSRIRKLDSDVQRASRQREVLGSFIKELMSLPITKIPSTAGELLSICKTNLDTDEVIKLGTDTVVNGYKVKQSFSPETFSGEMINGVYYSVFDINAEANRVHKMLFE